MAIYTVANAEGKKIRFDWTGAQPPTESDFNEIFASVRSGAAPIAGKQPGVGDLLKEDTSTETIGTLKPQRESVIKNYARDLAEFKQRTGSDYNAPPELSVGGNGGITPTADQFNQFADEARRKGDFESMRQLQDKGLAITQPTSYVGQVVRKAGQKLADLGLVTPTNEQRIEQLRKEIDPAKMAGEEAYAKRLDLEKSPLPQYGIDLTVPELVGKGVSAAMDLYMVGAGTKILTLATKAERIREFANQIKGLATFSLADKAVKPIGEVLTPDDASGGLKSVIDIAELGVSAVLAHKVGKMGDLWKNYSSEIKQGAGLAQSEMLRSSLVNQSGKVSLQGLPDKEILRKKAEDLVKAILPVSSEPVVEKPLKIIPKVSDLKFEDQVPDLRVTSEPDAMVPFTAKVSTVRTGDVFMPPKVYNEYKKDLPNIMTTGDKEIRWSVMPTPDGDGFLVLPESASGRHAYAIDRAGLQPIFDKAYRVVYTPGSEYKDGVPAVIIRNPLQSEFTNPDGAEAIAQRFFSGRDINFALDVSGADFKYGENIVNVDKLRGEIDSVTGKSRLRNGMTEGPSGTVESYISPNVNGINILPLTSRDRAATKFIKELFGNFPNTPGSRSGFEVTPGEGVFKLTKENNNHVKVFGTWKDSVSGFAYASKVLAQKQFIALRDNPNGTGTRHIFELPQGANRDVILEAAKQAGLEGYSPRINEGTFEIAFGDLKKGNVKKLDKFKKEVVKSYPDWNSAHRKNFADVLFADAKDFDKHINGGSQNVRDYLTERGRKNLDSGRIPPEVPRNTRTGSRSGTPPLEEGSTDAQGNRNVQSATEVNPLKNQRGAVKVPSKETVDTFLKEVGLSFKEFKGLSFEKKNALEYQFGRWMDSQGIKDLSPIISGFGKPKSEGSPELAKWYEEQRAEKAFKAEDIAKAAAGVGRARNLESTPQGIVNDLNKRLDVEQMKHANDEAKALRYGLREGGRQATARIQDLIATDRENLGALKDEAVKYAKLLPPDQRVMVRKLLSAKDPASFEEAFAKMLDVRDKQERLVFLGRALADAEKYSKAPSVDVEAQQQIKALYDVLKKGRNTLSADHIAYIGKRIAELGVRGQLERFGEVYDYKAQQGEIAKDILTSESGKPLELRPLIDNKADIKAGLSPLQKLQNDVRRAINGAMRLDIHISPIRVVMDLMDGSRGTYDGPLSRNFGKRITTNGFEYFARNDATIDPVTELYFKNKITDGENRIIAVNLISRQEGGFERLVRSGYDEKNIKDVIREVDETPRLKEFADKLHDMWNDPVRFKAIQKLMKELYNKDVSKVEHYSSWLTDHDLMMDYRIGRRLGITEEGQIGDGTIPQQFHTKTTNQKFTISRQRGAESPISLDALGTYIKNTTDTNYFLTMQKDVKMLTEIVNAPEFGEKYGTMGQEFMKDWLDTVARKGGSAGVRLRWLDVLRRNAGVGVLGFKITTMLYQPMALLDAGAFIGLDAVLRGVSHIATSPEWRKFVMKDPVIANRVGDDSAFTELGGKNKYTAALRKASMKGVSIGDQYTAAAAYAGAYDKKMGELGRKVDLNTVDPEAAEYARLIIARSQASMFFWDEPLAITRGGSWNKAFFQFQNFLLNRWSAIRHDAIRVGITEKDPVKATRMLAWFLLADYAAFQIQNGARKARGTDKEDDNSVKRYLQSVVGNIPIASHALNFFQYGSMPVPGVENIRRAGGELQYAFKSKKPETKAKHWKNLASSVAAIGGVPGAVQASDLITMANKEDNIPVGGSAYSGMLGFDSETPGGTLTDYSGMIGFEKKASSKESSGLLGLPK